MDKYEILSKAGVLLPFPTLDNNALRIDDPDCIVTKLMEVSEVMIHAGVLYMNLRKKL